MLDQATTWARHELQAVGVENPEREAILLAAAALGLSCEALVRECPSFDEATWATYQAWVGRRIRREPFAYIVGHQEFFGLDLLVNAKVLIPRPETEVLVSVGLKYLPQKAGRVVDVGTGSGAVALALAARGCPDWAVEAVDCDLGALDVARKNRERLGLRVTIYPSDLLAQVSSGVLGVLANLPYVADGEEVDPEVHYEPRHAVFAGGQGLGLLKRLMCQAPAKLFAGGFLALEVGIGQAEMVGRLMTTYGFQMGAPVQDLSGIARVVWGVWPGV